VIDVKFIPAPAARLPFSGAVVAGDLVFISGQASVGPGGEIISGSFEDEMRRSMENLRAVLASCGIDWSAVIQTRNYIKDPQNLPLFNGIYEEYFQPPYPARTTLSHCLGQLKFEIDAIAVLRRAGAA